ncbi:hypothetical protein ACJ41O_009068 [Fusarium nematophilum]
MKITPTSVSLSLILHAIDHIVLPDVTSKALQDQLGYIRLAVDDLLKRHGPLADFLRLLTNDGLELEQMALQFLDHHNSHHQASAQGRTFDELWDEHAWLTSRLNQLCERMVKEKPENPQTDDILRQISAWEVRYYRELPKISSEPFKDGSSDELRLTLPLSKDVVEELLSDENGPLKVRSLTRNPGGFSKQTYFVTVEYENGTSEELVIRLADYAPLLDINTFDIAREFDLLSNLCKLDFPCPTPKDLVYHPETKKPFFFTMYKLKGSMISPFVEAGSTKVDEVVWLRLAELLAKLHNIPLESFRPFLKNYGEEDTIGMQTSEYYRKQLKELIAYLTTKPHLESPSITWAVRWLQKNIPGDERSLVLVHGDFNLHNILGDNGQVTGVVDWETSTFGSVEHDLAYIKPHVSQHMDWEKFVAHYISHGGRSIKAEDMPFYTAFAWTQLMIGASQLHASMFAGRNRDIRFVMCEQAFTSVFMGTALECTMTT